MYEAYKTFLRACWTLGTFACPVMLAYRLTRTEPGHDYHQDWRN